MGCFGCRKVKAALATVRRKIAELKEPVSKCKTCGKPLYQQKDFCTSYCERQFTLKKGL